MNRITLGILSGQKGFFFPKMQILLDGITILLWLKVSIIHFSLTSDDQGRTSSLPDVRNLSSNCYRPLSFSFLTIVTNFIVI